jgi:hypothetical protein
MNRTLDQLNRIGKTVKSGTRAIKKYHILDGNKNKIWYDALVKNYKTNETYKTRKPLIVSAYDESKAIDLPDYKKSCFALYNFFVPHQLKQFIVRWCDESNWNTLGVTKGNIFELTDYWTHITGNEEGKECFLSRTEQKKLKEANKRLPKEIVINGSEVRFGLIANNLDEKYSFLSIDVDTSRDIDENHGRTMRETALELHNLFYHKDLGDSNVKRMIPQNISKQSVQYLLVLSKPMSVRDIQQLANDRISGMKNRDRIDFISPNIKKGMRLPFDRSRPCCLFGNLLQYYDICDIESALWDDDAELTITEDCYDWMLDWGFRAHNVSIPSVIHQVDERKDEVVSAANEVDLFDETMIEEVCSVVTPSKRGNFRSNWYSDVRYFMATGRSNTYVGHSNTTMSFHYLSGVAKLLMAYGHNHSYIADWLWKSVLVQRFDLTHAEIENIVERAWLYDKENTMMKKIVKNNPEYSNNMLRLVETGMATFTSSAIEGKVLQILKDVQFMEHIKGNNNINDVAKLVSVVIYKAFNGVGITNNYIKAVIEKNNLAINKSHDYITAFISALAKTRLVHRTFTASSKHLRSKYEIGEAIRELIAAVDAMAEELATIDCNELAPVVTQIIDVRKKINASEKPNMLDCVDLWLSCAHFCLMVEKNEIMDQKVRRINKKLSLTLSPSKLVCKSNPSLVDGCR